MSKRQKISRANLPLNYPLSLIIAVYLILDKIQAQPFAWGAFWTFVVVVTFAYIVASGSQEYVDIFEQFKIKNVENITKIIEREKAKRNFK